MSRSRRTLVPRWLSFGALALASCGDSGGGTIERAAPARVVRAPRVEELPDVLLISIDSLRADHLGCYGYTKPTSPAIDRLASEGVVCELAVSTTSWTLPAHAALFTGQFDTVHGVVDNGLRLAEARVTLAELLRDAGYRTAGFFGGPYLHPVYGLAQGFESWESCMSASVDASSDALAREILATHDAGSHADVTGPRTLAAVRRLLEEDGDARPLFCFVHLWDVHHDYIPPPEYARIFDPDYAGSLDARDLMRNDAISGLMSARDLQHLVALYDGEIRFTDEHVAAIHELVRRRARPAGLLTILTADHGEEFLEHGGKGHQRTLFEEVVRVPLVVHWPGRLASARVKELVSLVDVLPTVLALARIDGELDADGRDVAELLRGGTIPGAPALLELHADGRDVRALCQGPLQVVLQNAPSPYNGLHRIDQGTGRGTGQGAGDAAPRSLDAELRALEAAHARAREHAARSGAGAERIRIDAELERRLRGLGYTGDEPR